MIFVKIMLYVQYAIFHKNHILYRYHSLKKKQLDLVKVFKFAMVFKLSSYLKHEI